MQNVCMHILDALAETLRRTAATCKKWAGTDCSASVLAAYTGSTRGRNLLTVQTVQRLPGRSNTRQMRTQANAVILPVD